VTIQRRELADFFWSCTRSTNHLYFKVRSFLYLDCQDFTDLHDSAFISLWHVFYLIFIMKWGGDLLSAN